MSKLPYADKNLGQHFLVDRKVIELITNSPQIKLDGIVEVGPGPGILSELLAKKNIPYFVVEKDRRFEEYLTPHLLEKNIIFDDALKFNYQEHFLEKEISNIWLVSNLPYNISAPLSIIFFQLEKIKFMTLMYQKEVAEKIFSDKKNKMNSLMALAQNYFKVQSVCKVKPGAFSPPPKVDSQVLSFCRIETPKIPLVEFHQYESFLRLAFSMKRKQLKSVLKSRYLESQIVESFNSLGIPLQVRAESLTLEQISDLFLALAG